MFAVVFAKLQKYLRGKIVEPNVAGGILASMCKSVVQARPAAGLAFFVPYLSDSVTRYGKVRYGTVQYGTVRYSTETRYTRPALSAIIFPFYKGRALCTFLCNKGGGRILVLLRAILVTTPL
jgi:hypothetical protein